MSRFLVVVASMLASTAIAQGRGSLGCSDASTTQAGCINTGSQSFAGSKQFTAATLITFSMSSADSSGPLKIVDSSGSGTFEVRDGESVAGNWSTLIRAYSKNTGHGFAVDAHVGADSGSYAGYVFDTATPSSASVSSSSLFIFRNAGSNILFLGPTGLLTTILGFSAGAGSSVGAYFMGQGARFYVNNATNTHWLSDTGSNLVLTGEPMGYDFTDNSGSTGSFAASTARFRGKLAAAAATLTVTSAVVTTASSVLCQLETIDATCLHLIAVPGSGTVAITCQASTPATAATTFSCLVAN